MEKDELLMTTFTESDTDDFNLENLAGGDVTIPDDKTDDKGDDNKDDDDKGNDDKKADDKNQDDKGDEDKKVEDKKVDDKKVDDKKVDAKGDDKKVDDKKPDTFDIFSEFKGEENLSPKAEMFDYVSTLSDLGVELKDEKVETREAFVNKVKSIIETSKQTLNLDDYPPEVKMVIENLKKNNNLTVTDWYRNDNIRRADSFLALSDETKAAAMLKLELKSEYDSEDIEEAVKDRLEDMTASEIKEKAKQASKNVLGARNKELEKIISEKNSWLETQEKKDSERVISERKILREKLASMKDFFGFPIPDSAKQIMDKEIENGTFQKFLDENVADAKILAYLGRKLGKKIDEGLKGVLAFEKAKAYKEGTDVSKKIKHNIVTKSTGIQKSTRTTNDLTFDDSLF